MRLIHYNILDGCAGAAARCEAIAGWLCEQQADIITLNECNGWTSAGLAARARGWGHAYSALMTTQWGYHLAVTACQPVQVLAEHRDGWHHGALHVTCAGLDVMCVHLAPTFIDERLRRSEAATLAALAQQVAGPLLIAGDLNGIAPADWPDVQTRLTRREWALDCAQQRALSAVGMRDSGAGHQDASIPTQLVPGDARTPPMRFDYVYANAAMVAAHPDLSSRIARSQRIDLLSDHRPVVCTWT